MSNKINVNRSGQASSMAAKADDVGQFWDRRMRLAASLLLAALMAFWFSQQALSQDVETGGTPWHWSVERVSGRVMVQTRTGETFAVKRGMTVRKGWKIKTGGGRVVINRGEETFVVSPNSVVTLEPKGVLIKRMVVYQDRGQVDVDVKRRWYRHFKVETPFLAAVVKGTQFRVKVGNRLRRSMWGGALSVFMILHPEIVPTWAPVRRPQPTLRAASVYPSAGRTSLKCVLAPNGPLHSKRA